MPDKTGGWRKKIHGKSKEAPPQRVSDADATAIDDFNGRRRPQGWRKTVHVSRPVTPLSGGLVGTADDEVEDARSERSEASTPHRHSKPKFSRYLSQFSTIKESAKEPDFAEPWSENAPLICVTPINPLDVLQHIHSHMINRPLDPIPLQHNSGLFRIFEDYRKVRNEKEQLSGLLHSMFQDWGKEKEVFAESVGKYQDEIRRLELHIAQGTTGMSGLMHARQGSVLDRKRRRGRGTTIDKLATAYEGFSQRELDEAIRLKSQKIQLHRPTSPSGKMTALSRKFSQTGSADDIQVGNPSDHDKTTALSRKVKSELDLFKLGTTASRALATHSADSEFSKTGDQPSVDMAQSAAALIDSVLECDAFAALEELGTLVARKRGINAKTFVDGITTLLFDTKEREISTRTAATGNEEQVTLSKSDSPDDGDVNISLMPHRTRKNTQSSSTQKRRRHFSFEPGDDQLGTLEFDIKLHQAISRADSSDSDPPEASRGYDLASRPSSQALSAEMQKPSKIPSPVQTLGRIRRENSVSSMRSSRSRLLQDDHRTSRSSVLTTFRENSRGSLIPVTKSRSGSTHNLHQAEAHPAPRVVSNERLSKDHLSDTPPGRQRRLSIRHQQHEGI